MKNLKNNHVAWNALKKMVAILAGIIFLAGCVSPTTKSTKMEKNTVTTEKINTEKAETGKEKQPLELGLEKRMFHVSEKNSQKKKEKLYSFRAKDMPIPKALELFARINKLNMVVSPDVTGEVRVNFKGLSLERSMEAILDAYGYYWQKEEGLIRVYKLETKTFTIDYLRLIREGKGSSQATIASSAGGEGGQAGEVTITQSDEIKFWEEIEEQLDSMISEDGNLIVSRMSGTIQVNDLHKNVARMEHFVNEITSSILRQVEIEVKILEVTLNDDFSLGINWEEIMNSLDGVKVVASTILASPLGASTGLAPSTTLEFGHLRSNYRVLMDALQEQGEIKVLSQPKVRAMNNQPAMIKVGTDRPFFEATTTPGVGGSAPTVTEEVRYITIGLVLSITPQISDDGYVMLDITPIISRLVGVAESSFKSTAPIMDVKQSSTTIRLRDGEMVTVGGLIQDEETERVRKIPLLADIPFLGKAFQGVYTTKSKKELVIFLTPRIIKS